MHTVLPVVPARPKSPPRQLPSPPPRERPTGGGGGGSGTGRGAPPKFADVEYRDVWRDEHLGRPGKEYRDHYETFMAIPGVATDSTDAERVELWKSYVQHMVKSDVIKNSATDNPFWAMVGIHPDDFDWDDWRHAMGYERTTG